MVACQTLACDLLKSVDDRSTVAGERNRSKTPNCEEEGHEVGYDGSSGSEQIVSSSSTSLREYPPLTLMYQLSGESM